MLCTVCEAWLTDSGLALRTCPVAQATYFSVVVGEGEHCEVFHEPLDFMGTARQPAKVANPGRGA